MENMHIPGCCLACWTTWDHAQSLPSTARIIRHPVCACL